MFLYKPYKVVVMNVRQKAMLALAFVVLELSFWSIFLKIGGSSIGIIPQLFYGFLVGFIVSLAVSLIVDKGRGLVSIAKNRNMLLVIIVIGLLNNALTQLFLGMGTLGTNPSIGAIVYRSYIILVALLAPIIIRQKVKKMQWLAAIISFLGIYIILSGGTLSTFNASTLPFIAMLLVSALCTTFSALFMNKYTFNVLGAVVMFNLSSLIFMALLAFATHTSLAISFAAGPAISVIFLGIFAYGIGSSLVYYSIKVYGPLLFGNVILLVPFLSVFLAALITGTQIMTYYLAAAALISAGVVLQRRYFGAVERATSKKLPEGLTIFDITGAFVGNKSPIITNQIMWGNRALAIKLGKIEEYDHAQTEEVFKKRDCIAFTNIEPHKDVRQEEMEFIKETLGVGSEERVLVAIGDPKRLESAFEDVHKAYSKFASEE